MSRHNSNKRRMIEELKKHIDAGEDTFTAIEIILGEKVALKAFGLKAKPIVVTKKTRKKSIKRSSTVKNVSKHAHLNDYK
jgi:hypothetical protein